ncbi:response regulator [Vibrio sinensis]|uniref:histidine kinase n=1 Tax=Vibrio sinensis TaxID=2302434 RepID=A0A3A6QJ55_9VIBR|nr:hybrid sensor histidine kinase/response regulator [Vibrio sinensis]RJX67142.1 response regulator [Vibrio sinensis]
MDAIRKVYQYAEPNLSLVGWMGLLGYPTYYYVWHVIFPQPYENLGLRVLCALLFGCLVFRHVLPSGIQRHMPLYYCATLSFCLPFFFAFMMFKNDWSTTWVMSFLASIFLHVLLCYRTYLMLLQSAVGVTYAFFIAYNDDLALGVTQVVWPYLSIFLFTYVFGNLFFFRSHVEHEGQVSIAKSFGAGIAHEMRNPLSALKASIDAIDSLLPQRHSEVSGYQLSQHNLHLVREVLNDANDVIRSGTDTIDLLLTSIDENRMTNATYKRHSMRTVVEKALTSFPYTHPQDRLDVHIDFDENFDFFGSNTLLRYTLYNLLKNAFYYRKGDSFSIHIQLKNGETHNQLILLDNGAGIEPKIKERIFDDFYSSKRNGGHGLGLPFCQKVMLALGGSITCDSEWGNWTEFTLTFPKYGSKSVANIKQDMMKSKSVLYVGAERSVLRSLIESSFYQGFRLSNIGLNELAHRDEHDFEFSLILIDYNAAMSSIDGLRVLEQKLSRVKARLVFVYNEKQSYDTRSDIQLCVYLVTNQRLLEDTSKVIDELFFDLPLHSTKACQRNKSHNEKRVLLADDNHSFRVYTALILEQHGLEVLQAENGGQALELLNEERVDLVILDVEMPIKTGIDVALTLRANEGINSKVPILGYTADSSADQAKAILGSGMNDHLIKPADVDKLFEKISQWIEVK